jgi:hypothetical protein
MKTTYITLIILLFAIAGKHAFGQELSTSNELKPIVNNQSQLKAINGSLINQAQKISYNIHVGSSFISSRNFGNSIIFYTSPEIKYRLNPNLNISAGVMLINTNIGHYYMNEFQNSRSNKAYFMSGFDYTKERLSIRGEILYGLNNKTYGNFSANKLPEYYARFQANYQISENFSLGLQIIKQNLNVDYSNPFGNMYYHPVQRFSPFYGY